MKYINICRLCSSNQLKHVLHLTATPPANEFVSQFIEQTVYPIDILECQDCGHAQLSCVVDPEVLFRNYVYVSGTSPSFVKHFEDYANDMIGKCNLDQNDLVVDIGSNDGTLLKAFQKRGMKVVGVDPATEIAKKATESGIPTFNSFFNEQTSEDIIKKWGQAKLICANNVFAHADNLSEIVSGIRDLMAGIHGCFVFEVSYLVDVINKTLFDTMYHEHLDYHHLAPLISFFEKFGMSVFNAERIDTHGGSLRVYVCNSISSKWCHYTNNIKKLLKEENELGLKIPESVAKQYNINRNMATAFMDYSNKIENLKTNLVNRLSSLKKEGKKIAAFGAPAKATTLMYHFGLDKNIIDFIVDDSPLKQGLFTPGKHVPVLPSSALYEQNPDYVVILAWNFADVIMKKHEKFNGHFIVPIPELKEY